MSLKSPLMNPIRFYKSGTSNAPNFSTRFPFQDNHTQREDMIAGVFPSKYYKDWIIDQELSFQFRLATVTDKSVTVYKPDGTTDTITEVDITPVGWTSEDVYKYTYTPDQEGVYYFDFVEPGYISDKIVVFSREKFRKHLIEIKYRNSENDYGMVFYDGAVVQFTGKTYFTGKEPLPAPENEISAYSTDRGSLLKLRSTPVRSYRLELNDIHNQYVDVINHIFSCDYILVNGIEVQSSKVPEIEEIEGSDLVNISIQILIVDNDYFLKEIS